MPAPASPAVAEDKPEAETPTTAVAEDKPEAETPTTAVAGTRSRARLAVDGLELSPLATNREVIRSANRREVARAKARMDEANARMQAQQAAGVESLAEASRRRIDEQLQQRQGSAEQRPPPVPPAALPVPPAALPVPPAALLLGATAESIAAELRRWPSPPTGVASCELEAHEWPLYLDHCAWLDEVAARYALADAGEALRHLVFVANAETAPVKKLIFLSIRCLHCHAGAGSAGGGIPKKPKAAALFSFQLCWLRAVQERSGHPSVEKTVRILCDYYRKLTSERPAAEAELFWRHRGDVSVPSGHATRQ